MLLRGKLFAGALCAGLLFGASQDATPSPGGGGGASGGGGGGWQVVVRRGGEDADYARAHIKAQNELIINLVTAMVTSRMLE